MVGRGDRAKRSFDLYESPGGGGCCCEGPAKIPAASGEVSSPRKKRDVGGTAAATATATSVCVPASRDRRVCVRAHVIRHPTRSLPVLVLTPRAGASPMRDDAPMFVLSEGAPRAPLSLPFHFRG